MDFTQIPVLIITQGPNLVKLTSFSVEKQITRGPMDFNSNLRPDDRCEPSKVHFDLSLKISEEISNIRLFPIGIGRFFVRLKT